MRDIALMIVLLALVTGPAAYAQPFGPEAEADSSTPTPTGDSYTPKGRGQQNTQKRLGKLENRVGKIDKRVTTLETFRGAADGQRSNRGQPLTVTLVSKKQSIDKSEIGIKLVLEFKNPTSYMINGFSGTLVFKPEGGSIYTRKMAYAHPIGSGETAQIEMTIHIDQAKQYLKFVKALTVKVVLINQQFYE